MPKIEIEFARDKKALTEKLRGYPAVFVVADRKIKDMIVEDLLDQFGENGVAIRGVKYLRINEKRKNLKTVESILEWLIRVGADKDALLLAVGGGITTDLTGFAACIYKRGIRYANMPTTLLAQIDAGIGGKTGCNVKSFKNMAGIIKQPEFTFINADFIRSLPWEEFCCGYAEMLKTFIIADPLAYQEAIELKNYELIGPLIEKAVNIKRDIVSKDEFDHGKRRTLNLGHTFAHAIECKSKGRIPHGLAVAMGIVMAARHSEAEKIANKGLADKIAADFESVGLPSECKWNEEQLAPIMRTDKKAQDGKVHFVLPQEIGKVVIK